MGAFAPEVVDRIVAVVGDEIILLSEVDEEIYLAQKLARVALRTHNVTTLGQLVNQSLSCPDVISTAT